MLSKSHSNCQERYFPGNPFPEGLSGEQAENFLERGLTDGSQTDDVVSVKMDTTIAQELKPIQKQIYFDKSMGARGGIWHTRRS